MGSDENVQLDLPTQLCIIDHIFQPSHGDILRASGSDGVFRRRYDVAHSLLHQCGSDFYDHAQRALCHSANLVRLVFTGPDPYALPYSVPVVSAESAYIATLDGMPHSYIATVVVRPRHHAAHATTLDCLVTSCDLQNYLETLVARQVPPVASSPTGLLVPWDRLAYDVRVNIQHGPALGLPSKEQGHRQERLRQRERDLFARLGVLSRRGNRITIHNAVDDGAARALGHAMNAPAGNDDLAATWGYLERWHARLGKVWAKMALTTTEGPAETVRDRQDRYPDLEGSIEAEAYHAAASVHAFARETRLARPQWFGQHADRIRNVLFVSALSAVLAGVQGTLDYHEAHPLPGSCTEPFCLCDICDDLTAEAAVAVNTGPGTPVPYTLSVAPSTWAYALYANAVFEMMYDDVNFQQDDLWILHEHLRHCAAADSGVVRDRAVVKQAIRSWHPQNGLVRLAGDDAGVENPKVLLVERLDLYHHRRWACLRGGQVTIQTV